MDDLRDPGQRPIRTTRNMAKLQPWWRRVFIENFWIKLTSIIIALALVVVVREDQGKEVDIELPVVLSNLNPDEVFVGDLPKTLRVRVRDRWSKLAKALERKTGPYLVDLRGFSDGSMFVFDREKVRQLLGISSLSIQSIYPSEFAVETEMRVERTVPVRPTLVGIVPEGYDIAKDQVKVTPSEIKVRGARSSVKELTELATYPLDMGAMDKDTHIDIPVQKPTLPFLFLDVERVRVDVQVRARTGKVSVDRVAVAIRSCPEDLSCHVDPPIVSVRLTGPLPTLVSMQKSAMASQVYVDVADLDQAIARHENVRPSCDHPAGVDCLLNPRAVNVYLLTDDQEKSPEWRNKLNKQKP